VAAPRALKVIAGTAEGTLRSLAKRHEFGAADRPRGYVDLAPATTRFAGVFRFRLATPGPLALRVVLRSPGPAGWRVQAWDAGRSAWDTLWRGRGAPSGRWTVRLLPLGARYRDGGTVRIRLVGRGAPLALDQLALYRAPGVWRPRPGTTWQWQLSGRIDTSYAVDMYDIDLFDTPQAVLDRLHGDGRLVVCYFSAGSWENWRPDAGDFPAVVRGRPLDGWPGERWLDVRRIDLLGPIMTARLDLAAEKGCDGVEPDNVDGYANRSGFPLDGRDQIAYNRWLAAQARARGLSVGLKNDLDQVGALLDHFDWALNEQCFEYAECGALRRFVADGKAVFGVEYTGNPKSFCPRANALGFSWLKKRLDLGAWVIAC
jgi:hypothetical protein